MFCKKCGHKAEDNSIFCEHCGEKIILDSTDSEKELNSVPHIEKKKNQKIGIISFIIFLLSILILILIISSAFSGGIGGRSYKTTIKNYFESITDLDAKGLIDLMPEETFDYMVEHYLANLLGYMGYDLDDWDDLKLTYDIVDTDDIKGDDLEEIQEDYEEIGCKVSAAKNVTVEIQIKYDGETEKDEVEIPLVKIGGKWYIDAR